MGHVGCQNSSFRVSKPLSSGCGFPRKIMNFRSPPSTIARFALETSFLRHGFCSLLELKSERSSRRAGLAHRSASPSLAPAAAALPRGAPQGSPGRCRLCRRPRTLHQLTLQLTRRAERYPRVEANPRNRSRYTPGGLLRQHKVAHAVNPAGFTAGEDSGIRLDQPHERHDIAR